MKNKDCESHDIAVKSFFLGPQAENADWLKNCVQEIFERWFSWRQKLYPFDGVAIASKDKKNQTFLAQQRRVENLISELMSRFENEIPKFSPRYIGHMFSEISLPALLGHIITLLHNPNNVSTESGKISIALEKEAIQALAEMVGYDSLSCVGHFTSGGTIANFEAILRARKRADAWLKIGQKNNICNPFEAAAIGWQSALNHTEILSEDSTLFQSRPIVIVPASYHYSWPKALSFMGLDSSSLWTVDLTENGQMCSQDLTLKLEKAYKEKRPVIMVVSVFGSTEFGVLDPINKIQDVIDQWQKRGVHLWHHVDGAYGGFFASMRGMKNDCALSEESLSCLTHLRQSTSIAIDPHKLGYVPYASGAFLTKDPQDYFFDPQNPAYIQFDFAKDPGPFTIEGSRSAAGAVATWLSAKAVGFNKDGYGRILNRTILARKDLELKLCRISDVQVLPGAETNISCFTLAKNGEPLSLSNRRTEKYIADISGNKQFFVSKTVISLEKYKKLGLHFTKMWNPLFDDDKIVCVRLCLMNPFLLSKESNIHYIEEFSKTLHQ